MAAGEVLSPASLGLASQVHTGLGLGQRFAVQGAFPPLHLIQGEPEVTLRFFGHGSKSSS